MSAPREIWLQTEDNPASTDAFKVVSWCESALNSTAVPYILKSDYDELQAKLTETERLNKVALAHFEKIACLGNGDSHGNSIGNSMAIDAIKEIEGSGK